MFEHKKIGCKLEIIHKGLVCTLCFACTHRSHHPCILFQTYNPDIHTIYNRNYNLSCVFSVAEHRLGNELMAMTHFSTILVWNAWPRTLSKLWKSMSEILQLKLEIRYWKRQWKGKHNWKWKLTIQTNMAHYQFESFRLMRYGIRRVVETLIPVQ